MLYYVPSIFSEKPPTERAFFTAFVMLPAE
jgi:hypothetical protein